MSMNTPIGSIIQTTAIKDFTELENIDTQQYLLGINNIAMGDGSKIKLEKILEDSLSADTGNTLEIGSDNKLLNIEEDTGVQAGTYTYPQNLVVNSKGRIESVTSGSPASVPIGTISQAGILKPDGSTIGVLDDGTISVDIDEISTELTGKADIDGSNMVSSVKNFDGQWVSGALNLAQGVTLPNSSSPTVYSTIDVSNYLPDDNCFYETTVTTYVRTSNVASYVTLNVSGGVDGALYLTTVRTTMNVATHNQTSGRMVVSPQRQVTIRYVAPQGGVIDQLRLLGYRRIGTNL